MSVKIRLKRMGSKKKPFYRLVATDSRMPRDGRFIETLGYYNPMTEPPDIQIHEDVVFKWFERGATPSENAASLLRRVGCLQKWDLMKAGVTGDELDLKVEAIKNQQDAAAARKQMRKKDAKTAKAAKDEEPAAEEQPAVVEEKPAAAEVPAAAEEKPAAGEEKPAAAEEKPATGEEQTAAEEKPEAEETGPGSETAKSAESDAEGASEEPEKK